MDKKVTFCCHCGDGWSDENFMIGWCCGSELSQRSETKEEEEVREKALKNIKCESEKLGW